MHEETRRLLNYWIKGYRKDYGVNLYDYLDDNRKITVEEREAIINDLRKLSEEDNEIHLCSECGKYAYVGYRVLSDEQGPLQHWVYRCLEHQFTIVKHQEDLPPRKPIELTVNNDNEDWSK